MVHETCEKLSCLDWTIEIKLGQSFTNPLGYYVLDKKFKKCT